MVTCVEPPGSPAVLIDASNRDALFWVNNCDALLTHLGVLELTALEMHKRYAVAFVQELRDLTSKFRRRAELEVKQ